MVEHLVRVWAGCSFVPPHVRVRLFSNARYAPWTTGAVNGCCLPEARPISVRGMTTSQPQDSPRHPFPTPGRVTLAASGLDAAWDASSLPHKDTWRSLYENLFGGAGELTYLARAENLHAYGWKPADLERECSPQPGQMLTESAEDLDEDTAEARGLLIHEVFLYHGVRQSRMVQARMDHVARLVKLEWPQWKIGELLGMSKQRVGYLMAEYRRKQ